MLYVLQLIFVVFKKMRAISLFRVKCNENAVCYFLVKWVSVQWCFVGCQGLVKLILQNSMEISFVPRVNGRLPKSRALLQELAVGVGRLLLINGLMWIVIKISEKDVIQRTVLMKDFCDDGCLVLLCFSSCLFFALSCLCLDLRVRGLGLALGLGLGLGLGLEG